MRRRRTVLAPSSRSRSVTLKGDVVFQFQSDAAFERVASLHGVTGVTNEIRVDEPR
jgi:osmotically-inducible protein OsmY